MLEVQLGGLAADALEDARKDLLLLSRRTRLIYTAIALAVTCALLICLLIALAFVDAFLTINLARMVGLLFVLAMVALIASLISFLREIFLAVTSTRRAIRRRTGDARA